MANRGDQRGRGRLPADPMLSPDRTVKGHTPSRPGQPATGPRGEPHTPSKFDAETVQLRAEPLRKEHDLASVLPRRFRVTGQLGEGGAGIVVQAHDTVLRRDVAIKVLNRSRDALEEARAAAELRHESIVTIFDVDPGGRYIVMELIDGETLQQRLARRGKLETTAVYDLGRALLGALNVAHERKIIHRDIKPANILFDRRERVIKLNDFGVARRTTSDEASTIAGTPAYMAPEVWEGAEPDARTDIFGVGVTLWEAAVGRPFRDDNQPGGEEDWEAREVLAETGDARLTSAIAKAIAAKPAERFASVGEFAAALGPAGGTHRKTQLIAIGGGVASVAAIAVGIFAFGSRGEPSTEVARPTIVATIPFVDRTGTAASRTELAATLAGELRHVPRIQVIGHDQLMERTPCTLQQEDLKAWRACAESARADVVVTGTLTPDGTRVAVELVVSKLDGTRLGAVISRATAPGVPALVRRHAHQIAELAMERVSGDVTIDPDLDLGIEALHQANFPEGRRLLSAVLAREPNQADALYYIAIALYWENAPRDQVDAAFARALAVKLTPVQDGIVRGFKMLDHHQHEAAIVHWRKLAEQFPTNTVVRYGLSEALFHGGYPADGVVTYRQLADADRDFRLALMHPFDYYIVRGDTEGAAWALARAQRFNVRNVTEWQVRMRVLSGDIPGAYSALAAENAQAEKRGQPPPFMPGLAALAMMSDDRATVERVMKLPAMTPPMEIAFGAWRGDAAQTRRGFDQLSKRARSRGRRGANDVARAAPLTSLVDDPAFAKATLAVIDETSAGDPELSTNEQLARVFLLARIENRAELARYTSSKVPEIARIATALTANLDGKPAREDWQQAFALSADGLFVLVGKMHLARALYAAKDHAGVLAVCTDVLEPRIIDLTVGVGIVPCLLWSGEAAEALDKNERAVALYRRVLAIRPALADPQRQVASAALRRLIR